MRQMIKGTDVLNIVEHIITKNRWEFYVTDIKSENFKICLVMGFAQEIGPVDLEEIKPYIILRNNDLSEILPAEGWQWLN